jgi:hypothetical protein
VRLGADFSAGYILEVLLRPESMSAIFDTQQMLFDFGF